MGLHRTAAYLPTVVPEAAYALLWLYLLNPLYGPVNLGLGAAGLPEPEWFTSSAGAMAAVVLMLSFTIGEGFVVALAARQEIPDELHDLARLEGSSSLHTLRRVTLPLMAPVLGLLAARDTALVLQASFVPALLVTGTGPDRATLFLPNLIYDNAFENLRYGYAAAMTLTMFVLTAAIVLLQQRALRRWRVAALS
jgi:multiple sugar transport system permease protein